MSETLRARELPQLQAVRCFECLDTSVAVNLLGPTLCSDCSARLQLTWAAEQLAETVWFRQERKLKMDLQTLNVARLLVHSTIEQPIARETLELLLGLSERKVKSIIEELRKEWILPIGATRSSETTPTGYFFITDFKAFLDWSRAYRAQAITSLATYYKLQRKAFPQFAGQGTLDFLQSITDELNEAIR